jgi:predicted nucleotidyltransferase
MTEIRNVDNHQAKRQTAVMRKEELKNKLRMALQGLPHVQSVKSLALFVSYVNGSPSQSSDVDVLIDFYPSSVVGYFELFDIQSYLESCHWFEG